MVRFASIESFLQEQKKKMQQDLINASFKVDDNKVTELKKQVVSSQFVISIFEFLPKLDLVKVQILNKRFYNGLTPRWRPQIMITQLA